MRIEGLGQLHVLSSDLSNFKVQLSKRSLCSNSFYAFVYEVGTPVVHVYELNVFSKHEPAPELRAEDPCAMEMDNDELTECRESDIIYTMTLHLHFPIYFVVPCSNSIWAISNDDYVDLKKQIENKKLENRNADNLMDISNFPVAQNGQLGEEPQKSSPRVRRYPLSSVHPFFDDNLLTCRRDMVHKTWSIQMVSQNQESLPISIVPFTAEVYMQNLSNSFAEEPSSEFEPVLTCITVEGFGEDMGRNVLRKESFILLFGVEALLLSSTVIVCGKPNGQVVWHSFFFQKKVKINQSLFQFKVLCDIQQPICGIHVFNTNKDGMGSSDMLLIIGLYGKVVLLPSQKGKKIGSFCMIVSYIPSPISSHIVVSKICHTTPGGDVWISEFLHTSNEKDCFGSHSANVCNVMLIASLVEINDVLFFLTFDGGIYLAHLDCLNEEQKEHDVNSLFDECFQQGEKLIFLQHVKKQQKVICSQLATIASLSLQSNLIEDISCSIKEMYNKEFEISLSFNALHSLSLDPMNCMLSISISRNVCHPGMVVSKTFHFVSGKTKAIIKIPSTFNQFHSFISLPWMVQTSLFLNADTEVKKTKCFETLSTRFPCHIKFQPVIVHALSLCVEKVGFPVFKMANHTKKLNVSTSVIELARNKLVLSHVQNRTKVPSQQIYTTFIFRLSIPSAAFISKAVGKDLCLAVLNYLIDSNDLKEASGQHSFTCMGLPFQMSVESNENFIFIKLSAESFGLLTNLRFSILYMLLHCISMNETSKQNVSVTVSFLAKLEEISRQIATSLGTDLLNKDSEKCLEMYSRLRREITSKLYF